MMSKGYVPPYCRSNQHDQRRKFWRASDRLQEFLVTMTVSESIKPVTRYRHYLGECVTGETPIGGSRFKKHEVTGVIVLRSDYPRFVEYKIKCADGTTHWITEESIGE